MPQAQPMTKPIDRNAERRRDVGEELAVARHLDDALGGGERRRKEQRAEGARAPFPGEEQRDAEQQYGRR